MAESKQDKVVLTLIKLRIIQECGDLLFKRKKYLNHLPDNGRESSVWFKL